MPRTKIQYGSTRVEVNKLSTIINKLYYNIYGKAHEELLPKALGYFKLPRTVFCFVCLVNISFF